MMRPITTVSGAAPLVTPAVTYYDFSTGQTVQITTTTGGNPIRNEAPVGNNNRHPQRLWYCFMIRWTCSISFCHVRRARSQRHWAISAMDFTPSLLCDCHGLTNRPVASRLALGRPVTVQNQLGCAYSVSVMGSVVVVVVAVRRDR